MVMLLGNSFISSSPTYSKKLVIASTEVILGIGHHILATLYANSKSILKQWTSFAIDSAKLSLRKIII